jgi:prepilin-type N-terminal cleavage/methylation domain-containing protein
LQIADCGLRNVVSRRPRHASSGAGIAHARGQLSTVSNSQFAIRNSQLMRHAVTLVELLIVIVVIAIMFGLAVPTPAESRNLKVQQGARMLMADIEFAQNESIAHPDAPRVIKLNTSNNTYWIAAAATPDTAITDPISGGAYLVSFGTGRGAGLTSMTIQSYSLGGDAVLGFDAYGVPDQSTSATITLQCGGVTKTLQVAAGTGEVTIQ